MYLFFQCSEERDSSHGHHVATRGGGGGGAYHHGNIQYVQPVKVIPHGPPVAAVPIKGGGARPSSGYGAPAAVSSSYGAPKPSYQPPSSGYGAPKPSYQAPKPGYKAPSSGYGAPKPSYQLPSSGYGAPKPAYQPPSSGYGAPKPTYNAPKPTYGAPKPTYGAPVTSYGAPTYINSYHSKRDSPASSSSAASLSSTFRHPFQTNFGEASTKRDLSIGDSSHHGHHGHHGAHGSHGHGGHGHHNTFSHPGHHSNVDLTAGTSFSSTPQHGSGGVHHGHHNSPHQGQSHRQGRKDECYCVPTSQCPSSSVMSGGAQDYSFLIDPRTRPGVHIVAAEDDDSIDLGEASFENNRARYRI